MPKYHLSRTPRFKSTSAFPSLQKLWSVDIVLWLCPSRLWNIKMALIAAYINAEVILVVTTTKNRERMIYLWGPKSTILFSILYHDPSINLKPNWNLLMLLDFCTRDSDSNSFVLGKFLTVTSGVCTRTGFLVHITPVVIWRVRSTIQSRKGMVAGLLLISLLSTRRAD